MKKSLISLFLIFTLFLSIFVPTFVNGSYETGGTNPYVNQYNINSSEITLYIGNISVNSKSKIKYLYTDSSVNQESINEIKKILTSDYSALLPTTAGQIKVSNNHQSDMNSSWKNARTIANQYFSNGTIDDISNIKLYDEEKYTLRSTDALSEIQNEKDTEIGNKNNYNGRKAAWAKAEADKYDADNSYEMKDFTENYVYLFKDNTSYPTSFIMADKLTERTTSNGNNYITEVIDGKSTKVNLFTINRTVIKIVNTSVDVSIDEDASSVHTIFNGEGGNYTVKYDTDDANELAKQNNSENGGGYYKVPAGNKITLIANPLKGYTFKGWYRVKKNNGDWTTDDLVSKDLVYTFIPTDYPNLCPVFEKINTSSTNNTDGNTSANKNNDTSDDWKNPFKDVKESDWFYGAVKYTHQNNLIAGYNETTFAPYDNITRGMIVTILFRMDNAPKNSGVSKFDDVKSNEWYSQPIKWAVDNGIIHGYGGTNNFGPNDKIIRQDLAGILRNYSIYKKKDVNVKADLTKFKDYKSVSDYAKTSIEWAVGKGVITGNADGTLNPLGYTTRAEAAAMIQKYCTKVGK